MLRFLIAGGVNAVVGLGTIFLLMSLDVGPFVSNMAGYALGLLVSFSMSRGFVFRAKGKAHSQGARFLLAFATAYLLNVLTLHVSIRYFGMGMHVAQFCAIAAYTTSMYALNRLFVFRHRS